ncbi:MAG: hypothetical protein RLZ81_375, partial [Pseudomonadota bacterium]
MNNAYSPDTSRNPAQYPDSFAGNAAT